MSGPEECEARSIALEKAYVHEVYEQISRTQVSGSENKGRAWPRVKQFLADLEPGSIVCDIGCGSGKYLNVNPSIIKIGADRCRTLADMAREKEHEVLLCDNLSLPFRDESFDAVLSIAVVHHFATTERRVGAIRELARVLRIGGRIIISVWAMEQRHRRFESQDVLVPWQRTQYVRTHGLTSTTTTSEDDGPPGYHQRTQTSDSGDSCRPGVCQKRRMRTRHKGRSIDPSRPCNSSPSSSSLSSPNETCYSFVRRALQKLAGGKRHHSGHHKPWFLDSWSSCTKDTPPQRYEPEGCEDCENDIQDLPIELRRLEEEQNHDALQRRQTFTCNRQPTQYEVILNHKSKSLSDILTVGQRSMVRSRSSVPSLNVPLSENESCSTRTSPTQSLTAVSSISGSKPRLVKQKKSLCEEEEENDEEEEEVEERRDKATDMRDLVKALPDFKIHTFGGTKKSANVFKQSSMNEELMSAERLREKERVRQNIQKQASLNEELIFRRNRTLDSIKDTFFSTSTAKRFQLLKNGLTSKLKSSTTGIEKVAGTSFKNGFVRILQGWKGEVSPTSKSETAPTPSEPVPPCTPPPENGRRCGSSSNSSSASDEKKDGTKPGERRHSREEGSDSSKDSSLQSDTSVDSEDSFASVIFVPKPDPPPDVTTINNNVLSPPSNTNSNQTSSTSSPPKSPQPLSPKLTTQPTTPPPKLRQSPPTLEIVSVVPPRRPSLETSIVKEPEPVKKDSLAPEKRHVDRLRKIQEILKSKTAPVTSRMSVPRFSTRSPFPLVRRCSTSATGVQEPLARPIPRLLSLELFNPETDDMDSDSSGVSSPDSVSSVISVLQEDHSAQKAKDEKPQLVVEDVDSASLKCKAGVLSPRSLSSPGSGGKTSVSPENIPDDEHKNPQEENEERVSPSISLLEAAADVASSLEETVDAVIQSSPRARRRQLQLLESNDTLSVLQDSYSSSSGSSSWSLHKSDSSSKVSPVNPNKSFQKYDSGSDWSLISKGSRNNEVSPVTDPKNNNWYQNKSEDTISSLPPNNENDNSQLYADVDTWDEDCRQHLVDFAEKLSQKLLDEIDQYRQQMCQQATLRSSAHSILDSLPEGFQDDPYLSRLSEELHDLTRLSEELQERNSYLASLNNNSSNESLLYPGNAKSYSRRDSCYGTESNYQSPKTHSMESLDRDHSFHSYKRLEEDLSLAEETTLNEFVYGEKNKLDSSSRQTSEDVSEDFDKCANDNISREGVFLEQECMKEKDTTQLTRKTASGSMLRLALSIESSDAGDISEQTASGSDSSRGDVRKDTDSAGKTPSTTSLGPESSDAGSEKAGSSSDCSRDMRFADRRMARCDGRSSSEEAPPKSAPLIRQKAAIQEPPEELLKTESCASSLSGSTSQESLPSDGGGGSITFHRFYHVFREGELDQLIEKYVDNLHIISSYYDHANWCIVAEKVQVWTI